MRQTGGRVRSHLRAVGYNTLLWTVRWTGIVTLLGLALMLMQVPAPASFHRDPGEVSASHFWLLSGLFTIPAALLVSFGAAAAFVAAGRPARPSSNRKATAAWSLITIFGCLVFVGGGAFFAIMGLMFSTSAPHLWKGDPTLGWLGLLIAVLLVYAGSVPAREALRALRGSEQHRSGSE